MSKRDTKYTPPPSPAPVAGPALQPAVTALKLAYRKFASEAMAQPDQAALVDSFERTYGKKK